MPLNIIALGVISLLELLIYVKPSWQIRKPLAALLILPLAIDSGLIAGAHFYIWAILLFAVNIYRIINLLRLVEGRTAADRLRKAAMRSSLALIVLQLILLATAWLSQHLSVSSKSWLYALTILQLVIAGIVLTSTLRHVRTTRPLAIKENYADRDLPSLSVCIPARNETEDLEACLKSLALNDYPKLEILVLDDCSQNKRTPEIIRAFAASGVRFISGEVPPERWLAKNYAYKQLADEANGTVLLFCGVDTRFQPGTLRRMVELALAKDKSMLSIIPTNIRPDRWDLSAYIVQPIRYAWELSLPRKLLRRPPVLSTCWLITAELFKKAGGFESVTHSISPESYFARIAAAPDDSYSFLQSDDRTGLVSEKSLLEQLATAVRTRYPQTHKRPEIICLLTLVEFGALLAPFILVFIYFAAGWWLLAVLSLVVATMLSLAFALVTNLTFRHLLIRGIWLLPFAAIYDLGLLNYSMWQYEFGTVVWKGRNVCIPVMQVVSELPRN